MGSHALLPGAAQYLLTSINIYFILKYHYYYYYYYYYYY